MLYGAMVGAYVLLTRVGYRVGAYEGGGELIVGEKVGTCVGLCVGVAVGEAVGAIVGGRVEDGVRKTGECVEKTEGEKVWLEMEMELVTDLYGTVML